MDQRRKLSIGYLATFTLLLGESLLAAPTVAQIVPDNSLGSEKSDIRAAINGAGQALEVVGGGSRRGGNLFHSFQEFNVGNLPYFSKKAKPLPSRNWRSWVYCGECNRARLRAVFCNNKYYLGLCQLFHGGLLMIATCRIISLNSK